jgi:hypothetical protein
MPPKAKRGPPGEPGGTTTRSASRAEERTGYEALQQHTELEPAGESAGNYIRIPRYEDETVVIEQEQEHRTAPEIPRQESRCSQERVASLIGSPARISEKQKGKRPEEGKFSMPDTPAPLKSLSKQRIHIMESYMAEMERTIDQTAEKAATAMIVAQTAIDSVQSMSEKFRDFRRKIFTSMGEVSDMSEDNAMLKQAKAWEQEDTILLEQSSAMVHDSDSDEWKAERARPSDKAGGSSRRTISHNRPQTTEEIVERV